MSWVVSDFAGLEKVVVVGSDGKGRSDTI